jgi:uncharacterized membrane protein
MNQEINSSKLLEKKHYNYAFICIIVLAIALRLLGINKGIGLDDYASIHMFSQPMAKTLQELRTDTHPPLYFVLLHFWTQINNSDAWMRLPSVFFSIATIFVVIKWLKSSSYLAALLGALYLATSPILLRYSHEIRGYSLLILATALTFLFASRILDRPKQKLAYLGLAFSLSVAVSTHIIGVMLVLPICVFIAFTSLQKNQKISWIELVASLLFPVFLFLFFYLFFLNNENAASRISWLPSVSFDLISFVTNFLVGGSTIFYYPNNLDSLITFIIFGILSYLTIVGKSKYGLPLLLTAIIYLLELIIYSLKTQIYWFTTALPILVPLVAFVAIQISSIQKKKIEKIAIATSLIISLFFTVTWGISEAWKPLEEYQKAARWLEQEWQPNSLGIIYPSYIHSPIKYYWNQLPSESVISLSRSANLKPLNKQLERVSNPETIFLVIRVESGFQKELKNFKTKLLSIASKFKNDSQIEEFLIISNSYKKVDKDRESLKQLLAVQQSLFGKIVSYDDFDTYIITKFRFTNQI